MLARNIGVQGDLALQDTLAAITIYCGGSLFPSLARRKQNYYKSASDVKKLRFHLLREKNDIQADGVYLVKGY